MPASEASLRITEAYRSRLFGLRSQLERRAELLWPAIEGLDDFTWTNKAAAATQNAQREAVALTGAYLTAFLSSEVGTRTRGPILDTRRYSGLSRDGRPLTDALRSPMIGVRFKLKEGATPEEALKFGLDRAKRMVSVDYDHAHRTALLDGLAADERFQGWQRAVTGTCGACAGDIAVEVSTNLPSIPLQVHPNCQCVTEPVVTPSQPREQMRTLTSLRADNPALSADGFSSYRGTGYQPMNGYLRGTYDPADPGQIEEWITQMDRLFDVANPAESPVRLYRGLSKKIDDVFPQLRGGDMAGKVVDEPAFSSATADRAAAESFAPDVLGADLLELTVDKSVRGVIQGGTEGAEVILQRDVSYVITGSRVEHGRRIIEILVKR